MLLLDILTALDSLVDLHMSKFITLTYLNRVPLDKNKKV
jgi:hypothetical protein